MSPTPPAPLFDEPMPPAKLVFGLDGRLPRRAWWLWGVLALLGVNVAVAMLLGIAGFGLELANSIAGLVVFWPAIAISVKRWHDRGKSGWWVLVGFVPVVGMLWVLVENGLLRGTPGPNRFGPDPLAAAAD